MNNKSLLQIAAIGLIITLLVSMCLYIAAMLPTSTVQAKSISMSYESGMHSRDYTSGVYVNCAYMGGTDNLGEIIYCDSPAPRHTYRLHRSHSARVAHNNDIVLSDNTGNDDTLIVVDNPVQDTPIVVDVVTNDDTPQIDNPPTDDNPTCEDKPEKDENRGNPGNKKGVGNAGEKTNKGMNENDAPKGDSSGNGEHGNSDNSDKSNN